jgi:AcrR family transcriptional regulator
VTTRAAIHRAAAELFARDGFAATTVRAIAAHAGVNAALVIRHFGSKEGLFLDVMRSSLAERATPGGSGAPAHGLQEVCAGELDGLGPRLARFLLDETSSDASRVRTVYVALSRAPDSPEVREQLQDLRSTYFIAPLAARLGGDATRLRARLIGVQLTGLMDALWVNPDGELTAADRDEVARWYGAALQRLIDP